jgi:hypothetical protein
MAQLMVNKALDTRFLARVVLPCDQLSGKKFSV